MSKIRDLRVLIGAAAFAATAAAGGVVVGVMSTVGSQAVNQVCYEVRVTGNTVNTDVGPYCETTNQPVACATPDVGNAAIDVSAEACVIE